MDTHAEVIPWFTTCRLLERKFTDSDWVLLTYPGTWKGLVTELFWLNN